MAGGSGTRFWPWSRRALPKQFLPLAGASTLLRQTFERLRPLVPPERVWVVTSEAHLARVAAEVPEVSRQRILGEPVGRSTAPCVGLAAQRVARLDPGAPVLFLPADHVIDPPAAFARDVELGLAALAAAAGVEEPPTVTFGVPPRSPNPAFGYIQRGEPLLTSPGGGTVHRAIRYREKPPLSLCQEFVGSGQFFWNSGIFLWTAGGILRLIEKHMPALALGLEAIAARAAEPGGSLERAIREHFGSLPSKSIDHGVLEHAGNVLVIKSGFDWDDVGLWGALERHAPRDEAGNSVIGRHLGLSTYRSIIAGRKRLIATIGVENLVVVETDDAVLVCSRDETEKVKDLVERLGKEGFEDLL
jgi:mannose-1-phosphate guanylyltransferase